VRRFFTYVRIMNIRQNIHATKLLKLKDSASNYFPEFLAFQTPQDDYSELASLGSDEMNRSEDGQGQPVLHVFSYWHVHPLNPKLLDGRYLAAVCPLNPYAASPIHLSEEPITPRIGSSSCRWIWPYTLRHRRPLPIALPYFRSRG